MFKFNRQILIILFAGTLCAANCFAFVSIEGCFIAKDNCPAVQSVRKNTNPGNITLEKDMTYKVLGKNKPNATHYQLKIRGANPVDRWVPVSCGIFLTECDKIRPADPKTENKKPEYLLALSWQPAFCQTHQHKSECETQTAGRYDADHFTLHGLWPQPRGNVYCGVSSKNKNLDENHSWSQLPKLNISQNTYNALMKVMPGTASYLHRHEWYKHGSCYDDPADMYFLESIALASQVNQSAVRELFAANTGKSVSSREIRKKFDDAFGKGAGSKIKVRCKNGMITELWINLKGTIEPDTPITDLLKDAAPADPGCERGMIDEVGY